MRIVVSACMYLYVLYDMIFLNFFFIPLVFFISVFSAAVKSRMTRNNIGSGKTHTHSALRWASWSKCHLPCISYVSTVNPTEELRGIKILSNLLTKHELHERLVMTATLDTIQCEVINVKYNCPDISNSE